MSRGYKSAVGWEKKDLAVNCVEPLREKLARYRILVNGKVQWVEEDDGMNGVCFLNWNGCSLVRDFYVKKLKLSKLVPEKNLKITHMGRLLKCRLMTEEELEKRKIWRLAKQKTNESLEEGRQTRSICRRVLGNEGSSGSSKPACSVYHGKRGAGQSVHTFRG